MNLKWVSDALDRLIAEANVCVFFFFSGSYAVLTLEQNPKNEFENVPVDTRHVAAKARKAKKGEHIRNRIGRRASLKDFPKEWLPIVEEKHDQKLE